MPNFSLKPKFTLGLEYDELRRKACTPAYPLWFKVGRRKSADYLSSTFWFSNPMNSRMKSVKHSKFQQIFFKKKKMSLYKSLKTKSPQFLNSAYARSLEASFLFTGLKSNNQGSTTTSALEYHGVWLHLRNLQIQYLNCKFEVKFKKWVSFILHNVLHLSTG